MNVSEKFTLSIQLELRLFFVLIFKKYFLFLVFIGDQQKFIAMVNHIVLVTWRRRRRFCTKVLAATSSLMSLILIVMTQILNSSHLIDVESEANNLDKRMTDSSLEPNDTHQVLNSILFLFRI